MRILLVDRSKIRPDFLPSGQFVEVPIKIRHRYTNVAGQMTCIYGIIETLYLAESRLKGF